jgi:hypothetical protein
MMVSGKKIQKGGRKERRKEAKGQRKERVPYF